MPEMRVVLAVATDDQNLLARAVEHFSRAATGLALEGVQAAIAIGPTETFQ